MAIKVIATPARVPSIAARGVKRPSWADKGADDGDDAARNSRPRLPPRQQGIIRAEVEGASRQRPRESRGTDTP